MEVKDKTVISDIAPSTDCIWVVKENGKQVQKIFIDGKWTKVSGSGDSISSVEVSVDNSTGIPSATATMSGSTLSMDFKNLKGEKGDQGNSGYSGAAEELEIVNNLTEGGAESALSAEMGKSLSEELNDSYTAETITLKLTTGAYINNSGSVKTGSSGFFYSSPIALNEGDRIEISALLAGTTISAISTVNGSSYDVQVVGLSASTVNPYEYTATEDCEVVVSGISRSMGTTTVYRISRGVVSRLDSLESKSYLLDLDKYRMQKLTTNPLENVHTYPGMTAAIRTWGFIGDSLSSGETWGVKTSTLSLTEGFTGYYDDNGNVVSDSGYITSAPQLVTGITCNCAVTYDSVLSAGLPVVTEVNSDGTFVGILSTTNGTKKLVETYVTNKYIVITYPVSDVPSVVIYDHYHSDIYDYSWGQYICRLTGATGYNYSIGGGSAKTFVTGASPFSGTGASRNLARLLADTQKQVYTIALGQNDGDDTTGYNTSYYTAMGDEDDMVTIENPTAHGNTFVGYYSEILIQIFNVNPDSIIFMATVPHQNRSAINDAIRSIYNHYKTTYKKTLWLIDLEQNGMGLSDDFKLNGLHLSAQGYLYAAYEWMTYIDWILRNNISDLNPILSLCGTGYNEIDQ